ncbi:MAG TPA: hypothetical protein VF725_12670 [Ktedonobacterales bacterium]
MRGRSQPGSSGSRRGSGADWGSSSGSGGGLLSRGGRRGGSGDSWDDEGYNNYAPPSNSRPGYRSPSGEYGGVDPSRALAQYNETMPPSVEGGMMAGVPGFPQTDEEERAIGMRRPAYIPATTPKRKRRLSSGRVISGMLSILLVTVGVCAGLGFLGQRQLAKVLSGPLHIVAASPTVDMSQVPAMPISTPGPAAKVITSAVTAHGIDNNYNPVDISSYFQVNSTVYVVANIVGASQKTTNTLSCTWFLDGIDYKLKSGTESPLPPSKTSNFHGYCALPYYQTGVGMVRIYWDRPASDTSDSATDPYLAQTIKFGVFAKIPGASTPTAKPKTPVPTKTGLGVSLPVAWRSEPGVN